ncbi:type II toxin-antitoxin system death-on-curing family toxin [Thalassotalea profundi]|uniref:Fido domain-containing protein n=1 Tax=Thalassotalea profundi TaxID=2036687 RepID=A0ABQ3IM84_9GAMM|nr:type II toxin-antitoxin system death-on-curing family toxin [Thalassotalea profundi]GHE84454.1 hypothetical protein GCM10011501_11450 [Thalassotalea profundi]
MLETFYFDIAHAIGVHDWIIEHSGGLAGTKNIGQLESVLEHIKNDLYYPSFLDKLNHLVFAINKFHAFNDGNKRSSIVLGSYFLEINGYDYCVQDFVIKMENITVWLAESKISKELLIKLIDCIIMEEEYPEELMLALITAVDR